MQPCNPQYTMHELKRIVSVVVLTCLMVTAEHAVAQNTGWLKRSWSGKAFILSNAPEQNYNLVLTIQKIKGNAFEGVLTTIKPLDTSVHFDTKVTGTIYDRHMLVNIGLWKVSCGSCKPQNLAFSIESGKMYLKGEAKGCSDECTWITVFSKDLVEFAQKEQEELFAISEEIMPPAPEEAPVAEAAPEVRTPLLPPGGITPTGKGLTAVAISRPPARLQRTPGLAVNTAIPEKRTVLIPAGEVVVAEKAAAPPAAKRTMNKQPGLAVNTAIPDKRTVLIPAGEVVVAKKATAPPPVKTVIEKQPGIAVNTAIPDKRTVLIPAGEIAVVAKAAAPPQEKRSMNKQPGLAVNTAIPDKRTALIPAGEIAVTGNSVEPPPAKRTMNKQPGLAVNTAIPDKRTVLIPAGEVAMVQKAAAPPPARGTLNKQPTLAVNTAVPEKRTVLIPAGEVAIAEKAVAPPPAKVSIDKNTSVAVNTTVQEKRTPLMAPGAITPVQGIVVAAAAPKQLTRKPAQMVPKTPLKLPAADAETILPEGYADRKKNVVRSISVNTDSITLRVYDNGVVDGDIVSVVYNDLMVVNKLSLVARALEIKLPVKKGGNNSVVFHAHNLGEFPPNTAKLEIIFGTRREELTISSDYTVSSAIDIVYAP